MIETDLERTFRLLSRRPIKEAVAEFGRLKLIMQLRWNEDRVRLMRELVAPDPARVAEIGLKAYEKEYAAHWEAKARYKKQEVSLADYEDKIDAELSKTGWTMAELMNRRYNG